MSNVAESRPTPDSDDRPDSVEAEALADEQVSRLRATLLATAFLILVPTFLTVLLVTGTEPTAIIVAILAIYAASSILVGRRVFPSFLWAVQHRYFVRWCVCLGIAVLSYGSVGLIAGASWDWIASGWLSALAVMVAMHYAG